MHSRSPEDSAEVRLGPYRLLHCIAQGGMGEVHLATLEREAGFRKRVAIKRALPHLASDPRVAERFEREARLSAVLGHRHIVQVFDFGRAEGGAWLAMEYVHGVDLKAVQDRLGSQPLLAGVALEIGLACAAGLHHAHGARDAAGVPLHLVHRDVSPHNVLLSFDGDVKLTDFGLADAATGPEGPDGLIQGKYAYMSPEQARGGAVDARADQYALGVVLYELLGGARAFQSFEGPLATLDRVAAGRPLRPLAELHVAPPLVEVVERAMQVEPEARFPDMQQFAAALRAGAAAAGLVPGEPPLAEWLRDVFPERVPVPSEPGPRRSAPAAAEVTAAAFDPISAGAPVSSPPPAAGTSAAPERPGLERTLDAVSPVALEHTVDAGVAVSPPPGPARTTAPAPPGPPRPTPRTRAWFWVAAAVGMAGGLAMFWPVARPPTSELPADGTEAPRSAPVPATTGATPPSASVTAPAIAPSAVATTTPSPAPSLAVSSAPRSGGPGRGPRPAPSGAPSLPLAEPAPATAAPLSAPPPVSAPPPISAPPPASNEAPVRVEGPRVRVAAEGARVRDAEGGNLAAWRPLAGGSVLAQVIGGTGPPVSIRLLAGGRMVRANVTARPHGEVRLDGVALGGTPLADIPLRPGRRALVVRAPDGSETRVTIEVAVDGADAVP